MHQMHRKTSFVLIASSLLVMTGCSDSAGDSRPTQPAVITSSETLPRTSASPTVTVTVTPSASKPASASPSSSASPNTSDEEVVLSTATTPLGEIIVGKDGMPVYFFKNDVKDASTSNCNEQCLVNWPPVLAESDSPKVENVTAEVKTIDTPNGQKHVTVNGMPLYYRVQDKEPGDVTGQGIQDIWYVVAPDGRMIESSASTETPAPKD